MCEQSGDKPEQMRNESKDKGLSLVEMGRETLWGVSTGTIDLSGFY